MHQYAINSAERKSLPFRLAMASIFLNSALAYVLSTNPDIAPYLKYLPALSAFGLYGIFYTLFDKYLWQWKWIRLLLGVKIPILKGEWQVVMSSSLSQFQSEFRGRISVEQTWSRILISFDGTDAFSNSHSAAVTVLSDTQITLTYVYQSEDRPGPESADHIFFGTCRVKGSVDSSGLVSDLEGSYFTEPSRKSWGRIRHQRITEGTDVVPQLTPEDGDHKVTADAKELKP